MKKKLAALLCAAMLACALPALAWADEAAEPTADQATAQESAAARSIGPWQESASNEDGSCVLSGEGDASYSADFVMTLVPSKADVDEPAANEPAADTSAALPSGADTGATSPKTGMDAGALAGASFAMLAAAGVVALALRRKLAK